MVLSERVRLVRSIRVNQLYFQFKKYSFIYKIQILGEKKITFFRIVWKKILPKRCAMFWNGIQNSYWIVLRFKHIQKKIMLGGSISLNPSVHGGLGPHHGLRLQDPDPLGFNPPSQLVSVSELGSQKSVEFQCSTNVEYKIDHIKKN